jgi:hypothetical protein
MLVIAWEAIQPWMMGMVVVGMMVLRWWLVLWMIIPAQHGEVV